MSSRTVPRFALTALLVAALAAPAVAQEGGFQVPLNAEPVVPVPVQNVLPAAPMPRAKGVQVELSFGAPNVFEIELKWSFNSPRPVAVAPMPRASGDAARSIQTYCWQTLRDEVYMLAGMPPPMVPPQAGAFVIGASGLQRVMPMPEPPRFLVAPTPVPTGSFVIGVGPRPGTGPVACGPALVKHAQTGCCLVGACCGAAQSLPTFVPPCVPPLGGRGSFGVTSVVYEVCPPCPLPVASNPLNGTWYRDAGVALIAVTFAGDEMTVRMSQCEGGKTVTVTLTAHCTVTKDGLVYGAITSGDVDLKDDGKTVANKMDLAELSLSLQELTDMPFSFRARATTAGLMVSHLKVPVEGGGGKRDVMILGGLYKHAKDGKVPELKPLGVKTGVSGRCDTACHPSDAPVPPPVPPYAPGVERIGFDFNVPPMGQPVAPGSAVVPAPQFIDRPVPPAPPCQMPQPVRPAGATAPTDALKELAKDAFQQMIWEKDACRGGMTLPSPRYPEHYPQYFAPDVAFPLPRELACQEAAEKLRTAATQPRSTAEKPGVVGTWVREVGSKRCVMKIAPDHFTATVSEAQEVGGKTVTGHLIFTVDYHLARDGMTAVGLLTGVDAKFDGDVPAEDAEQMMQRLGELQKLLEDKPLALTFRVYGDALVIGNVRMQTTGGLLESEPAAYIGGRYRTTGDKPLPALKAVKACEPKPLPVYGPPSPYAGNPLPIPYGYPALPPGGFCPTPGLPPGLMLPPGYGCPPGAPVGDLLPPQHLGRPAPVPAPSVTLPPLPVAETIVPAPAVRVIEAVTIPEPLPSMTVPTAPVPVMPAPVPPGTVRDGAPLLFQSEDLRRMREEWIRFWFNDRPNHLTPERIHGGIY